jgi:hypothetical protein
MKDAERETVKKWVDTWKRAGVALAEIKKRELVSPDYGKNREVVDDMLEWACEHRKERTTSGLLEQQRIFMKIAGKARPGACKHENRKIP